MKDTRTKIENALLYREHQTFRIIYFKGIFHKLAPKMQSFMALHKNDYLHAELLQQGNSFLPVNMIVTLMSQGLRPDIAN